MMSKPKLLHRTQNQAEQLFFASEVGPPNYYYTDFRKTEIFPWINLIITGYNDVLYPMVPKGDKITL